jgi:hypothetical protein
LQQSLLTALFNYALSFALFTQTKQKDGFLNTIPEKKAVIPIMPGPHGPITTGLTPLADRPESGAVSSWGMGLTNRWTNPHARVDCQTKGILPET